MHLQLTPSLPCGEEGAGGSEVTPQPSSKYIKLIGGQYKPVLPCGEEGAGGSEVTPHPSTEYMGLIGGQYETIQTPLSGYVSKVVSIKLYFMAICLYGPLVELWLYRTKRWSV